MYFLGQAQRRVWSTGSDEQEKATVSVGKLLEQRRSCARDASVVLLFVRKSRVAVPVRLFAPPLAVFFRFAVLGGW